MSGSYSGSQPLAQSHWVDSHPHYAYRWFHHPYLFGGRVETAPEAVSVLLEELYEMKGGKVDQGDRKGVRGLQAGAATFSHEHLLWPSWALVWESAALLRLWSLPSLNWAN